MLKKRAHPTGIEHAKQRLRSEHNNHAARRPYYLLEWVHIRFLFAKFPNFGQLVSRNLTASTQILLLFLNLRLKLHVLLNFQAFFTNETFLSKTRCIASGRKSTGGHWVSRGGRLFSYWPEIQNQCVRIPYSPCLSYVPSPLNPFSAFCGRKVVTKCPGVVIIKFLTPDSESWGYFTLIWCIIRHICEKPHFDDSSTNRKPETSTNPNFFESLQFSVIKGSF